MNNGTTYDKYRGFTPDGNFVIMDRTERGVTQTLLIPVRPEDKKRALRVR